MAIDRLLKDCNDRHRCRHASIGEIPAQFIRGAMKRTHSEGDMVRALFIFLSTVDVNIHVTRYECSRLFVDVKTIYHVCACNGLLNELLPGSKTSLLACRGRNSEFYLHRLLKGMKI